MWRGSTAKQLFLEANSGTEVNAEVTDGDAEQLFMDMEMALSADENSGSSSNDSEGEECLGDESSCEEDDSGEDSE